MVSTRLKANFHVSVTLKQRFTRSFIVQFSRIGRNDNFNRRVRALLNPLKKSLRTRVFATRRGHDEKNYNSRYGCCSPITITTALSQTCVINVNKIGVERSRFLARVRDRTTGTTTPIGRFVSNDFHVVGNVVIRFGLGRRHHRRCVASPANSLFHRTFADASRVPCANAYVSRRSRIERTRFVRRRRPRLETVGKLTLPEVM